MIRTEVKKEVFNPKKFKITHSILINRIAICDNIFVSAMIIFKHLALIIRLQKIPFIKKKNPKGLVKM